jgi:hypothetical protein
VDLEVKVQGPMKVITVCDIALWSCTHIPNIIDLYRKKQLFDREVKGQGPTKGIMVCNTPPYGHAPTFVLVFFFFYFFFFDFDFDFEP